MSVNVSTDPELDRLLSVRSASSVPFPPEIALAAAPMLGSFFDRRSYYTLLGVQDHPVVRLLEKIDTEKMVAITMTRVHHLEKLSHLRAWLGDSPGEMIVGYPDGSEATVGRPNQPSHHLTHPCPHSEPPEEP